MAFAFLAALRASRRFGKATRLQERGMLQEALSLLAENRVGLASTTVESVSVLSLRLMNLVHFVEVAAALGHSDMAKGGLLEWLATWESARRAVPSLATNEPLAKWEKWVRAKLEATQGT